MLLDIINEAQALSAGINPAIFRGSNAYLHIRFAPVESPADAQIGVTPDEFIGLCASHRAEAPTDAASYIWVRINYESAEEGRVAAEQARVTAEQGRSQTERERATAEAGRATTEQERARAEQGRTTAETARTEAEAAREAAPKYLYVRYAMVENPTDAQISATPANCQYVGFVVTASKTAPTAAGDYAWARFRGLDGEGAGDMLAQRYDTDNDGKVDAADVANALAMDATIQPLQVEGLENALSGKAGVDHNHNNAYAALEHGHEINNVDGLGDALDGKSNSNHNHSGTYALVTHEHSISNVTGLDSALSAKATSAIYTATIPATGWTGSEAPFKIDTITVGGILASDTPIVDIVQTGTEATDSVMREDWPKITRITTKAGGITVYASEIPSAAIPIQLKVVR